MTVWTFSRLHIVFGMVEDKEFDQIGRIINRKDTSNIHFKSRGSRQLRSFKETFISTIIQEPQQVYYVGLLYR